ncbi:MAG TPA: hypothetical protein VI387_00900, partial [Candidatus Brocadiales bacterium]|nr:hypothetical protein [Candidatus Brocadiales bacterium]
CRDLISTEMVLFAMRNVPNAECGVRSAEFKEVSPFPIPNSEFCIPKIPQSAIRNPHFEGVDLYRTQFDCDGMLECVPVTKRPLTDNDILRYCYRSFWKNYLGVSRKVPHLNPPLIVGEGRVRGDFWNEIKKYYTIEASIVDLKKHIQSFNRLSALCNAGIRLINEGIDASSFSKKIDDIDKKIINIDGCASFLTNLYVIEKTNMAEDITALTKRDILELYMRTQRNALLMKGMLMKIEKTVDSIE